ncbi:class I SAM-dependent methyltransferase [Pseudoalteromonas pernae]|uniref:class I SAM-dependent methyltransferase n=1 Tax=Pseudoalteromonas pernae TaxID=3118054 RepID=UPI003242F5C1
MSDNIHFYSVNAESLATQYDKVPFESVHKDWLDKLPTEGVALDIGAGSGRDARYLAAKGLSVIAVEPAEGIREVAQRYTTSHSIHWLDDRLPDLVNVLALQMKFDLILLSAVWMHIPPSQRERSFRKLSSLLKPNGRIVISLRHGCCDDERTMYDVCEAELSKLASQFGLTFKLLSDTKQQDELGRDNVSWQTVMCTLPDDGTGAFPLIRNIVVNDSKASTYKIALLRSLLRIAEGHPGAVIERSDEHVALPMGLVALYWLKLYKPLIDTHSMQQNSNNSKGLGFIKENGWGALATYTSSDFYVGASYQEPVLMDSLYKTLKDIASTIKNMPAKYTTIPGTTNTVFDVELFKSRAPKEALNLDFDFLCSLGKFYVPKHIWDALSRISIWIEPALINEWATLMSGYGLNKSKHFTKLDYLNALTWHDPQRSTNKVRDRVNDLLHSTDLACCWSSKSLSHKNYAVDHAFPYSRWPNNDLWNLLPTLSRINAVKSDKLPTTSKLATSREFITHWWQEGWDQNGAEFFSQANLALPNLSPTNRNFDDVFEAMKLQRDRIKDIQQLQDWY